MNKLLIALLIVFAYVDNVYAYSPTLSELCATRYVVNQQHFEEQAHKSSEIFSLLRDGKSLPAVIAEIYDDEMMRFSANAQLKDVAMYQAAFMQEHISDFSKLTDEEIASWWLSNFEATRAI